MGRCSIMPDSPPSRNSSKKINLRLVLRVLASLRHFLNPSLHCPPHGYITSTYASRRVNETPSTLFMFFLLSCLGGFLHQKKPSLFFFFFFLFSPPLGISCKQNKQQVGRRGQPSWLHDVNLLICAMFEAVALVNY